MYPLKFQRLKILFAKLLTTICIVMFLLYPTPILREKLKVQQDGFEDAYTEINFRPEHHFCAMPEARAVTVTSEEISNALNLPNGTQYNKELAKYGECRAKLTKLKQDLDLCSCKQQIVYIIMILASIVCFLFQLAQMVFGPWQKSNVDCSVLAYLSALMWLFMACLATAYHTLWYDEIWLPDALYAQSYFKRPISWSMAVVLCFVYFALTVIEVMLFDPKSDKRVDRSSESVKEESEVETLEKVEGKSVDKNDVSAPQFRILSDCDLLLREPLPQPKLANALLIPPKPKISVTWP